MAVTAAELASITTGYNVAFRRGLTSLQGPIGWQMMATEVTSTNGTEVYPISGRIAKMREWDGDRIVREHQVYGYELRNKKFEDTVSVLADDMDDDKYGLYDGSMEGLGQASARLPYEQVVEAVVAGVSTVCFDGEYYFDTDHPIDPAGGSSTTYANEFGSMTLSATNVALGRSYMEVRTDEYGVNLGVTATHLAVPPALRKLGEEICRASTIIQYVGTAGTDLAATSPTNVLQGQLQLIVIPELHADSDTTWYLFDLSKSTKPFSWQWRLRPQFASLTRPDSETVFYKDKYVFGAKARGAAGFGLPHLASRFQSTSL